MRKAVWVPVVVIIALLLTACGAAQPPSTGQGGGETFMLALPRMVVDVDPSGSLVVFGLNTSDVGRLLGADLSTMKLAPQTVKQMTDANVQHIEMRQVGDAMVFLANAKPLPHVGWSDQSLRTAMDVAAAFGVQNTDTYKRLLPLVRRFGLDLVLRFPRQAGAAEIPLADPAQAVAITPNTDPPSAIVQFEIKYDDKGDPSIMGLTAGDLQALGVGGALRISPETVQRLQAQNIQNMELRSKNSGMYIYANGEQLPNVVWDDTLLTNLTDLYAQLNANNPNLPIMKMLLPWIDKADVDVLLHFPIAAGQQAIPAKMHP